MELRNKSNISAQNYAYYAAKIFRHGVWGTTAAVKLYDVQCHTNNSKAKVLKTLFIATNIFGTFIVILCYIHSTILVKYSQEIVKR